FNSVFKFGVFNVIQSKCLNDTFYENNNLVISAPTGSGKTVLMELTIIRVLLNHGDNSKIIYIAPTKSLCSERVKDWENKFKPFGIVCKEFTGDTNFVTVSSIRNTSIIITTPEKWDAITRRCIDSRQLMQLIKLFLIDEVHILNEKRGACLEACVSRMQTIGHNLRFIAVSATVPNLQDIATWLKAKPISFSEEYRPIKLNRFVYAFPLHEPNMFLFDRKLDWKLLDMIQKHSNSKPVLIFCSTRKSAEQSCNTLLQMIDKKKIPSLRKIHPACKLKNKALPKLVERGLAFHHAGLDSSDRSQIENLFLSREIRVITTTSTLAVGVNLPAHLVIIKSTQGYQERGFREYSDLDLLQMVGRAGRPGLDTSGSAVILTTLDMERRYNTLISGTTNIESWLHENMIEHLMSEICLGTITDIHTGLNWLRSTFLYIRVSKNPIHYRLEPGTYMPTDSILQEICAKDLELLKQHNLIEESFNKSLKPTAYGLAMDRYYMKYPVMIHLLDTENPGSVKDTLYLLCQAQEETGSVRFNNGEKSFLNTLAKHPNIRFPIERVISIPDKIFILVQCLLGDISLYNSGNNLLATEASSILITISRVTKCVIDCSIHEKNPVKLKFAAELYQSLQAKMWSTSPYVARQIEGIGSQFAKTLAQANMISMEQLRNCDPGRIEMILNRNPPFGTKVLYIYMSGVLY
ncbi:P-loop containing nucleoside triphosphate hydrolase protein, partial [Thamnidium elegans]